MTPPITIRSERGARDAAAVMDWGVVINETMAGDVDVYLIGQCPIAEDPPSAEGRARARALLLQVTEALR